MAEAAPSSKAADVRSGRPSTWRRIVRWLYVVAASLVVFGVFLQAFSIAAYVRGAGTSARDLHENGGFITHNIEIAVFMLAVIGFWGAWRLVAIVVLVLAVALVELGRRSLRATVTTPAG